MHAPLCPGWDASLVASAKEEPEVERTETAELPRATAELGSAWLRLARQHMRPGAVWVWFLSEPIGKCVFSMYDELTSFST